MRKLRSSHARSGRDDGSSPALPHADNPFKPYILGTDPPIRPALSEDAVLEDLKAVHADWLSQAKKFKRAQPKGACYRAPWFALGSRRRVWLTRWWGCEPRRARLRHPAGARPPAVRWRRIRAWRAGGRQLRGHRANVLRLHHIAGLHRGKTPGRLAAVPPCVEACRTHLPYRCAPFPQVGIRLSDGTRSCVPITMLQQGRCRLRHQQA